MTYLRSAILNYSRNVKWHANDYTVLFDMIGCHRTISVLRALVLCRAGIIRAKAAIKWLSGYRTNVPVDTPILSRSNSYRALINRDMPVGRDASSPIISASNFFRDHESKGRINLHDLTHSVVPQKITLHENDQFWAGLFVCRERNAVLLFIKSYRSEIVLSTCQDSRWNWNCGDPWFCTKIRINFPSFVSLIYPNSNKSTTYQFYRPCVCLKLHVPNSGLKKSSSWKAQVSRATIGRTHINLKYLSWGTAASRDVNSSTFVYL